MKPIERLLTTLSGKTPDRVPVYTLIPFALEKGNMIPGPFHGYSDYDEWRKKDPLYCDLVNRMSEECDNFFVWRPECMNAQNLLISPGLVKLESKTKENSKTAYRYKVVLDDRILYKTEIFQDGTGHKWITEHFCKSIEDAMALMRADYSNAPCETDTLFHNTLQLGDRGLPWVTIPSPIMTTCRIFDPQDFLMFSTLYRKEIEGLMELAFSRTRETLLKLLESKLLWIK